VLPQIIDLPPL